MGVTLSMIVATLLVAISFHFVPRLTRPELFFAVTVPADYPRSTEARRILLRYRLLVWLGALASLAIAILLRAHVLATPAAQLLLLGAALLAYIDARRRVLPRAVAPSTVREAALGPRPRALPGGWALQLGPLVLLALAAARTIDRGREIVGALVAGVALCALLGAMAVGLARAARPVAASGDAARAERDFKRLGLLMLVGAEYLIALEVLALALAGAAPLVPWLSLVGTALLVALAVALARLGQGGTRRAAPAPEQGAPVGDRTRDAQWKWGLFYADRSDPALFVEKRFGIGYTLNFGNPWAWVILGVLAAVVIASLVLAAWAKASR